VIERAGTKDPDPSARRDGGVDRILLTVQARTLLPAANLMSEKATVQTETPVSSDEVAAAGRLIELAMRELKSLGDDKPAGTNEKLAFRADGSPLKISPRRV
jgi:hypothetical protein